jgi:hypothetical protein
MDANVKITHVDYFGTPLVPGQRVVYPTISGSCPVLEERIVFSVDDAGVKIIFPEEHRSGRARYCDHSRLIVDPRDA